VTHVEPSALVSRSGAAISDENRGESLRGGFLKMNARSTVRDAIRVRLMKGWLMRVRCPLLAKGYPAWKCRKNYLSLVRTHPSLAQKAGLRESDVYL
jgi:hypothetical protein